MKPVIAYTAQLLVGRIEGGDGQRRQGVSVRTIPAARQLSIWRPAFAESPDIPRLLRAEAEDAAACGFSPER